MFHSIGASQYQGESIGAVAFDPRDIGHLGVHQPRRNLGPFEDRAPSEVDARVKPGLPRLNTAHELATGLVGAWPVLSWDASELLDLTGDLDLVVGAGSPAKSFAPTIGPCIKLGGNSSFGVTGLGASEPLRTATAGTIAAWFRKSSAGYIDAIASMWSDLNGPRWWLGSWTSGQLRFQASDGSTISAETAGTYADGLWHLAVGTFEASGKVKLYIDGDLVATSTGTLGASLGSSTSFEIGCWNDGDASNCHPGDIADARIWSRALSAAEIARMYADPWALYRVTKKPDYPVLDTSNPLSDSVVLALPLSEGGGTTVADISGNGNHGTATAASWDTDAAQGPVWKNSSTGDPYINVPASAFAACNAAQAISVAFWVRFDTGVSAVTWGRVVGHAENVSDGMTMQRDGSNASALFTFKAGGNRCTIDVADRVFGIYDGDWHHLVLTWAGGSSEPIRGYMDGIQKVEIDPATTFGTLNITTDFRVGHSSESASPPYEDGLEFADVRIFDRALPASDVADLAEDPWLLYLDGDAPAATGVEVTPAAATLTLTATAPAVELGFVSITPSAAVLTLTATDPTVTAGGNVSITPAAATLTLSATAPSVLEGSLSITPAAAALALTATDPGVELGSLALTPGAASLALTATPPSVLEGSLDVTPGAAVLTLTATPPTVTEGGNLSLTPGAATIMLSATDPGVLEGSLEITPTAAVLVLTATPPTVTEGGPAPITPEPAVLTLSATPPIVELSSMTITPAAAVLTLTATDPVATADSLALSPGAATLTLSAELGELVLSSVAVTPEPAVLTLSVTAPEAGTITEQAPFAPDAVDESKLCDALAFACSFAGESITYHKGGIGGTRAVRQGLVERSVRATDGSDPFDTRRGRIMLWVTNRALDGIAEIELGRDQVELLAALDDDAASVFRVVEILEQGGGGWKLELAR